MKPHKRHADANAIAQSLHATFSKVTYFEAPLAPPPPGIFAIDLPNFNFSTGLLAGGSGGTLVLFFIFFNGGAGEAEVERKGSCVVFCFFAGGPVLLLDTGRGGGDIAFPDLAELAGVDALLVL